MSSNAGNCKTNINLLKLLIKDTFFFIIIHPLYRFIQRKPHWSKQAIFSRYLCENKLQFYEIDDDDVRFVLDQHTELEFYIVLAH
jgi:hypothetical protein